MRELVYAHAQCNLRDKRRICSFIPVFSEGMVIASVERIGHAWVVSSSNSRSNAFVLTSKENTESFPDDDPDKYPIQFSR